MRTSLGQSLGDSFVCSSVSICSTQTQLTAGADAPNSACSAAVISDVK